jgi:type IV pilus biogenesis protein CpaD/CtpE
MKNTKYTSMEKSIIEVHVPSQDKELSTATVIEVHVPSQDKGLSTATVIEVHVPSQDKGFSTATIMVYMYVIGYRFSLISVYTIYCTVL